MFLVNRNAVILKGKQPLVDWINSHDAEDPVGLEDVRTDCNVYLLSEMDGPSEASHKIEANVDVLFESELQGWYVDESMWPENRTIKMFREWFDIEYHSMVVDVLEDPIRKDLD